MFPDASCSVNVTLTPCDSLGHARRVGFAARISVRGGGCDAHVSRYNGALVREGECECLSRNGERGSVQSIAESNGPEYSSGDAPDCGDRIVSESEVIGRDGGARRKYRVLPHVGKAEPMQQCRPTEAGLQCTKPKRQMSPMFEEFTPCHSTWLTRGAVRDIRVNSRRRTNRVICRPSMIWHWLAESTLDRELEPELCSRKID